MTPKYFRLLSAMAIVLAVSRPAHAQDRYQVTGGEVVVLCPLTIGGSFEARTRSVIGDLAPPSGQPGSVSGSLRVDLQSLETGIGLRDRHMRTNYLEVDKGPDFAVATIEEIQLDKLEGKTAFRATLVLHGRRREVTGSADVRKADGRFQVTAQFPVRVSEFDIPPPLYLGIGVRDQLEIQVKLTLSAVRLSSALAPF
jgi:polyisoprenoid-binding protein YceI